MLMRTLPLSLIVLAALVLTAERAWGMGEILGQTKEELKLKYDVSVQDHGTGRVTVVLTLADEGRLKPLDAVELYIPMESGSGSVDLAVALATTKADGKQVARVHLKKEWAERAQIWLTTTTFDGKQLVMTRYHHVIPFAKYVKDAAAAKPAAKPAPAPTAAEPPASAAPAAPAPAPAPATSAPPATERKKD